MSDKRALINRHTWEQFAQSIKTLLASEVGGKAKLNFSLLIALLLGISGLNVMNSYVGRDFMTAIADRDNAAFIWLAALYVGVFAASTLVSVFYTFTEERLGLIWRKWLTARAVNRYLGKRTYYHLVAAGNTEVANPDQRIADDIRTFTQTTLSFVLMILNGTITVLAFSSVLWSISPLLFGVSILYAATGSFLTVHFGRSLVRLNYDQLDKEANFRSNLIHVRQNADSVALLAREGRLKARLLRQLESLTVNYRQIISVNRRLNFFTTGYNWLIQIIPALIVAPLFIRGEVEFGVVTQSAMAFTTLLGAFSLIVTQFHAISSYAAVLARLGALRQEMIEVHSTVGQTSIEIREEGGQLAFEHLTLRSSRDNRPLIKDLTLSIPRGNRVLIRGPSDSSKVVLFRAIAGIWGTGVGSIVRPNLDEVLFLPERPYLPPGTLRELLLRTGQEKVVSEERIMTILRRLKLERVLVRAGGLDTEQAWNDILSIGEQQHLAFARLLLTAPQFALLDRPRTVLSPKQVEKILGMLSEYSISYITLGGPDDSIELYDGVIQLAEDGGWEWLPIPVKQAIEKIGI